MTTPFRGTVLDLEAPDDVVVGEFLWDDGSIRDAAVEPATILAASVPELVHSNLHASAIYRLSGITGLSKAVSTSDSRLSDARTPLSHTHTLSQIVDAGTAASHAASDFDSAGAAAAAQAASQPLDSDLTAIAALTTTSFGRGGLIQADAASFRTYIGAGTSSFDGAFASLTAKPTTLNGYGITDAQPLDSDLTAIAALSTTSLATMH